MKEQDKTQVSLIIAHQKVAIVFILTSWTVLSFLDTFVYYYYFFYILVIH